MLADQAFASMEPADCSALARLFLDEESKALCSIVDGQPDPSLMDLQTNRHLMTSRLVAFFAEAATSVLSKTQDALPALRNLMRKLPALSAMKVFEVVGQTRSFTRAAQTLNLTQSAVSRQVRNLEKQLGENLLIRHHHDLELTRAGAELLATLQLAFHNVEQTVRSIMEKNNHNRLRINVPPTFAKRWLMPRLPRLRQALPEIEISLSTDLKDTLAERSLLDCAIRFGDGEWPMLQSRILMTERHIAVCAPGLLSAAQQDGQIDLSRFTSLHVLAAADRRYLTWQHWLDAAGLSDTDVRGGLEFDLLDLVIEAACNGLGIAVVDRFMVSSQLQSGQLVRVLDVEIEGHESYWLVTRTDQPEGANVQRFRTWLMSEIAPVHASNGAAN